MQARNKVPAHPTFRCIVKQRQHGQAQTLLPGLRHYCRKCYKVPLCKWHSGVGSHTCTDRLLHTNHSQTEQHRYCESCLRSRDRDQNENRMKLNWNQNEIKSRMKSEWNLNEIKIHKLNTIASWTLSNYSTRTWNRTFADVISGSDANWCWRQ